MARRCSTGRISGVSLKNDSRSLYGSHRTITTIPASKSRHVPGVSLARHKPADSARRGRIGRVGKRKRRPGVSVCGSHYCETRMDDIRPAKAMWNTWRRARRPEGSQLRDRASGRRQPLDDLRELLASAELCHARNRSRKDASSSRLFANFGNIRSFSPARPPLPTLSCRASDEPCLSHP